jgi:hypothetical protein
MRETAPQFCMASSPAAAVARWRRPLRTILLLAMIACTLASAAPAKGEKNKPPPVTLRWSETQPGCTFSSSQDGKYQYGFWSGDVGVVLSVDAREVQIIRHRIEPIFGVFLTIRYRGSGSLEVSPEEITLQFMKHFKIVQGPIDPDGYTQKIQTDADALDDETAARGREASRGEAGSGSAVAGISEISERAYRVYRQEQPANGSPGHGEHGGSAGYSSIPKQMDRRLEGAGGICVCACRCKEESLNSPSSFRRKRASYCCGNVSDGCAFYDTAFLWQLGRGAAALPFHLRRLALHDVAQRNQAAELLAFDNRQVAEAELVHDEQTFLDAFVHIYGARIRGHHLGNRRVPRGSANRDNPIHNVALGKNSRQFAVTQHRKGADVVLHHEASGFQNGIRGVNGINFAVFHELAESEHKTSRDSKDERSAETGLYSPDHRRRVYFITEIERELKAQETVLI